MLAICFTVDSDPDAAGQFDEDLDAQLYRTALQFAKNGADRAHAMRCAFDELCPGEMFEDLSDDED